MLTETWDIRKQIPNYRRNPNPAGGYFEEPEDDYHRINLMVYLLEKLPYSEVYTAPLATVLSSVRAQVEKLVSPDLDPDNKALEALAIIDRMIGNGAAAQVTLRKFFVSDLRTVGTAEEQQLVADFEALFALYPNRLCFPWMQFQGGHRAPVSPADFDDHTAKVGGYYLKDFFTLRKRHNPGLADAIREGLQRGILAAHTAGDDAAAQKPAAPVQNYGAIVPFGGGGTTYNHRQCQNYVCVTVQNQNCYPDANGNCTTASP